MTLTVKAIDAAKPREKAYKLTDWAPSKIDEILVTVSRNLRLRWAY